MIDEQYLSKAGDDFRQILGLDGIREVKCLHHLLFVVAALLGIVLENKHDVFRDRFPNCFALQRNNLQSLFQGYVVQVYGDPPGGESRVKDDRQTGQFPDRFKGDLCVDGCPIVDRCIGQRFQLWGTGGQGRL